MKQPKDIFDVYTCQLEHVAHKQHKSHISGLKPTATGTFYRIRIYGKFL